MIPSFRSLLFNIDSFSPDQVNFPPNKNTSHQRSIQVWGEGKGGILTDNDLRQHLLKNPIQGISVEERELFQKVISNRKRKKRK